ncbi:hypothetical protein DYB32_008078 [Aphanomyces invadans]|uniref:Aldehyde dehydrogenase domain-containing protein n=1 Tax=Aphanomyces invadans TaxID=157072 RepID=A0A418AM13_9STRA|nr:hypothetical protein DYB32_008078 [Aphanomyces invadans]
MPESPSKRCKADAAPAALVCDNFINGVFTPAKAGGYLNIESPSTGNVIGKVTLSDKTDVDVAVAFAKQAFGTWSAMTVKARAAIMLKFHELIRHHVDELADLVVLENGKNKSEAIASVLKVLRPVFTRCMAASVLLLVGDCSALVDAVVTKAKALTRGTAAGQVGAIIDAASQRRNRKVRGDLSARHLIVFRFVYETSCLGYWVGPTVLLHTNPSDAALHDEIFGPVISVYQVDSFEEALAIENASPFGNAACIYTSHGGNAEYFQSRFRAGMIGVNVGVPVPRYAHLVVEHRSRWNRE